MRDFLVALYHFGAYYHSGQWSRGYRLMCQAATYLKREYGVNVTLDDCLTWEQAKIYFYLAEKYQFDV